MRIVVVGAGMYVTGKNNTGVGTVLMSLGQVSKKNQIDEVIVVARKKKNELDVIKATKRINSTLDCNLNVKYLPLQNNGMDEFDEICKQNNFDCAIIATPDHLHYDYAKLLLKKKIHCLVVKPLTPTLEESLELTRIQEKNGCLGIVEFHKRYDESNLKVKRLIDENKIGDILYFTVDYSQKIDVPAKIFRGWTEDTNVFQYLGVHYVDQIYFMTGFQPSKVSAIGSWGILKEKEKLNAFDAVNASILWKKSNKTFISRFSTNWIDPNTSSALSDQKFKIIGTKGRIEIDQKYRGLEVISENDGVEIINPYFSDILYDASGKNQFSGYGFKSIKQFILDVDSLKNHKVSLIDLNQTRPTFRDSLPSTATVDAVNRSLINDGEWEMVHSY